MSDNKSITETKYEALQEFLLAADPDRLSSGLRMLLLDYLYHEYDQLPHSFKGLTEELQCLFYFLDKLATKR